MIALTIAIRRPARPGRAADAARGALWRDLRGDLTMISPTIISPTIISEKPLDLRETLHVQSLARVFLTNSRACLKL